MGLEIAQSTFTAAEEERFSARLHASLPILESVLARPGWGEGPVSVGMELEMSLVDDAGRPLMRNVDVLAACPVERMALELNRFNIEYNSLPYLLAPQPFTPLAEELRAAVAGAAQAARAHGGRVAVVGILPTLREQDLQGDALTDQPRFHALSQRIRQIRQARFEARLDGPEPVELVCDDVTLEGANTSLQVHLQVPPRRFADVYNAAQVATGPVLALCGNSPYLVGRRGWQETRVALFRQAVDDRRADSGWRPARVAFGHGWVRAGATELFAESVALHAPLLPVCSDHEPGDVPDGANPELEELRLHHGTVWRWNRAVYDPAEPGGVRVEFRALPAGPTVCDMVANAAFMIGLTAALAREMDWMIAALPFRFAEYNFIEAARKGLDATLLWPARRAPSPRPVQAVDLLANLVEAADHGLAGVGVPAEERDRHLDVIRHRLAARTTGALWQTRCVDQHEPALGRDAALVRMLDEYLELSASDTPVHAWPDAA